MSYDAKARRDTPLARQLRQRIGRDGPISLRAYMASCLYDDAHGYYRVRDAIGRGGDFITAPEISQAFGELIGLWCAVVWRQMGAPKSFNLVELGPGRGTLMKDALRATRIVPGFRAAARLALVEVSERLREIQQGCLADVAVPLRWHARLDDIPPAEPTIIVANEFLDALPIGQLVLTDRGWEERTVEIDRSGNLQLASRALMAEGSRGYIPQALRDGRLGDILTTPDAYDGTAGAIAALAAAAPVAALFIDYGHVATAAGDTLQAVRNQAHEHILTSPGETDLSAQVDFQDFARAIQATSGGMPQDAPPLAVDGPVPQAEFLGALGIAERASRLMGANPDKAAEIELGVARLMAPVGMGSRFKAIGIRSPSLPPLPGLLTMDKPAARP